MARPKTTRKTSPKINRKLMSAETAFETGQVLAWRLPMLAMTMMNPTPARRAEAVRMISEKQKAIVDGAIEAQATFWRAAMQGSLDVHKTMADMTDAAHAPALRTLSGNVRRLSKRKSL